MEVLTAVIARSASDDAMPDNGRHDWIALVTLATTRDAVARGRPQLLL